MKLGDNGLPQTAERSGKWHIPAWNQLDSYCSVLAGVAPRAAVGEVVGWGAADFPGLSQEGVPSVDAEHQWGHPFRNLQRAPKAERVEYRMVFLVFGGWGREGATVDFVWIRASLGCSLSPSRQRTPQPAHPEWSRHLLPGQDTEEVLGVLQLFRKLRLHQQFVHPSVLAFTLETWTYVHLQKGQLLQLPRASWLRQC